ncbi:MAG: cytochrome c [Flavobacteriaceae bacterium]|nr:cytochrome c [Flavobacteriaceae bacterium]
MKHFFLLLLFLTFSLISCSSDDDTVIPSQNDVTYTNDIKSIIDSKCLNCHGNPLANGAPISLTNLDEVKEAVINSDLIGRVEDGSMPQGGTRLTPAQIQAIKDWKAANYPL